jgi:hypothetical protein
MKIKLPVLMHTKNSCMLCLGKLDKNDPLIRSEMFTYMCIDCVKEYCEKYGHEIEEKDCRRVIC